MNLRRVLRMLILSEIVIGVAAVVATSRSRQLLPHGHLVHQSRSSDGFMLPPNPREQRTRSTAPSSSCSEADAAADWTVLVEVRDNGFTALPGVKVKVGLVDREAVAQDVTDASGIVRFRLPPGTWHVEATLAGFTAGRHMLELSTNQVCTVKVFLRLDPKAVPGVT